MCTFPRVLNTSEIFFTKYKYQNKIFNRFSSKHYLNLQYIRTCNVYCAFNKYDLESIADIIYQYQVRFFFSSYFQS